MEVSQERTADFRADRGHGTGLSQRMERPIRLVVAPGTFVSVRELKRQVRILCNILKQ